MSKQATNFIDLCKGNNPSSISRAVKMIMPKVRKELMEHFGVTSESELVLKLM